MSPETLDNCPVLRHNLAVFCAKWKGRLEWSDDLLPELGSACTPALRQAWQTWVPADEYLADLAGIVSASIGSDWLPRALNPPYLSSIPELWRSLPSPLDRQLVFEQEQILPLVCSLAAPPRFGTKAGRYPEQIGYLNQRYVSGRRLSILDLGCGTGQGSHELASSLADNGHNADLTGVTAEALEVWMAETQHCPHLDDPTFAFPESNQPYSARFVQGSIESYESDESFDILLCNGLVGGPFLSDTSIFPEIWQKLCGFLKEDGVILLADRFHDGYGSTVQAFDAMAPSSLTAKRIGKSRVFFRVD